MSNEEIMGTLRMIQERLATILDVLTRLENRQNEVKNQIKSEPVVGLTESELNYLRSLLLNK